MLIHGEKILNHKIKIKKSIRKAKVWYMLDDRGCYLGEIGTVNWDNYKLSLNLCNLCVTHVGLPPVLSVSVALESSSGSHDHLEKIPRSLRIEGLSFQPNGD